MKSRISFYNRGVAGYLRRCFRPVWLIYLALLMLILPVTALSASGERSLDSIVQNAAWTGIFLSALLGIVAVMTVFNWRFRKKMALMMASFPVRRETLFTTSFIAGLMPGIGAQLIAVVSMKLLYPLPESMSAGMLWNCFLSWSLSYLSFYGFSVFCSVLTGNLIVLPVVYLVLNFTALAAERCVRALLGVFVYGMSVMNEHLAFLSPAYYLLSFDAERCCGGITVPLLLYAGSALLLSGCALLLFRKNNIETVTDVVAVPVLRPVFKYCMSFGTGVVFAGIIYKLLLENVLRGFDSALVIMLLLCLGAAIGYFTAEVLIDKTFRIPREKWKGLYIMCGLLCALTLALELDLPGYEKYVPAAEEVSSVTIWSAGGTVYSSAVLTTERNIGDAISLHEGIIAAKDANEAAQETMEIYISYSLTDGTVLSRRYFIDSGADALERPGSCISRCVRLSNAQECLDARRKADPVPTERNISYAFVLFNSYNDPSLYRELYLTDGEAVALYEECIVPDTADGQLFLNACYGTEQYLKQTCNATVYIYLNEIGPGNSGDGCICFDVCTGAERTKQRLSELLDIAFYSLEELYSTDNVIFG